MKGQHKGMPAMSLFLSFLLSIGTISTVLSQEMLTAFTYGQSTDIHVNDSTTLPFAKNITSIGQGARFQTPGVFVCQQDGVYKFQMYCLTQGNTTIWLELYRNQELVTSAWGHTDGDYADAGNAAVLKLTKGDRVYVKTHDNHDVALYGRADEIYTTFTGVRVGAGILEELGNGIIPAFSVAVSMSQSIIGGSSVLFDKVILDDTNAYNVNTGVYTAPIESVYVFHFFSLARQNEAVWLELYHNGGYVCSLYCKALTDYSDAGNTVILHLKPGDTVSLKARSGWNAEIYGQGTEIYTSFSGTPISLFSEGFGNDKLVAFSAGLSSSITVLSNNKVIFDRIFIDIGRAYDQHTGEFTAPVAGVYEFNFHAIGQQDQSIWLELYRNYKYINSLYSKVPGQYGTGSNAAVLELDDGDVIFVKSRNGYSNSLYGANDEVYCTFSGYLLAKTVSSLPVVG